MKLSVFIDDVRTINTNSPSNQHTKSGNRQQLNYPIELFYLNFNILILKINCITYSCVESILYAVFKPFPQKISD